MARIAAILVIASQLILLWMLYHLSGKTAIAFTFAGHPLVGLGVVLGLWALLRRKARERAAARTAPAAVESGSPGAPGPTAR